MARNTPILLGEHFEQFIEGQVASGRYSSASEVVKSALRLLETEEQGKARLVNALREGERSGIVHHFDPETHLARLHQKHL